MTHFLSEYQIAALQEMGISVWCSQTSLAQDKPVQSSENTTLNAGTPAINPVSRSDRLAQLRSTLNGNSTPAKSESPEVATAAGTKASQPPLIASQIQHQYRALLQDITRGLQTLNLLPNSHAQVQWCIGESLAIEGTRVVLPMAPERMDPAAKRLLWQTMCRLAKP